ncbi:hypothetical protein B7463_g5857, partial [Scytalidium lignicola]
MQRCFKDFGAGQISVEGSVGVKADASSAQEHSQEIQRGQEIPPRHQITRTHPQSKSLKAASSSMRRRQRALEPRQQACIMTARTSLDATFGTYDTRRGARA